MDQLCSSIPGKMNERTNERTIFIYSDFILFFLDIKLKKFTWLWAPDFCRCIRDPFPGSARAIKKKKEKKKKWKHPMTVLMFHIRFWVVCNPTLKPLFFIIIIFLLIYYLFLNVPLQVQTLSFATRATCWRTKRRPCPKPWTPLRPGEEWCWPERRFRTTWLSVSDRCAFLLFNSFTFSCECGMSGRNEGDL